MSAVCSIHAAPSTHTVLATVKGAPEVLREMYVNVPDDYDATYSKLMRQGARVLALGYKNLGHVTQGQVSVRQTCVECVWVCLDHSCEKYCDLIGQNKYSL